MNGQRNQIWGVRKEGYDVVYLAHSRGNKKLPDRKPKQMSAVRFSGEPKDFLSHHGVEGMHWGEITKEYEPVAFDKRKLKKSENGAFPSSRIRTAIRERAAKQRQKEAEDWRQTRKEMLAAREKRDKIAKGLVYGGAILAGLLAVYGAYKLVRIPKSKAYAGIFNRFMTQNPGSDPLGRASQLAKANSNTFGQARMANRYLKSRGLAVGGRRASRIYGAKRLIEKVKNLPQGKTKAGKALLEKMRNRLQARAFDRLYF